MKFSAYDVLDIDVNEDISDDISDILFNAIGDKAFHEKTNILNRRKKSLKNRRRPPKKKTGAYIMLKGGKAVYQYRKDNRALNMSYAFSKKKAGTLTQTLQEYEKYLEDADAVAKWWEDDPYIIDPERPDASSVYITTPMPTPPVRNTEDYAAGYTAGYSAGYKAALEEMRRKEMAG